jgi:ElaB/YqjD/DUF883 family membrane-anchored ribosome-binding protein
MAEPLECNVVSSAPPEFPVTTELPSTPKQHGERLNKSAETIGNVVGAAVDRVRHLPQRFGDMKQRLTLIRGRARDQAAVSTTDLSRTAQEKARQVRTRAEFYANEYPVESILAIAGAAFVLGVLLRVWRSSRA